MKNSQRQRRGNGKEIVFSVIFIIISQIEINIAKI
jgi:hypothetical protein